MLSLDAGERSLTGFSQEPKLLIGNNGKSELLLCNHHITGLDHGIGCFAYFFSRGQFNQELFLTPSVKKGEG
jgi:hypothetical protein